MKKTTVILVNLGTPNSLTLPAIRRFLKRFLSDKRVVDLPALLWKPLLLGFILPFRPFKLLEAYRSIWLKEGSPLKVYTQTLAEKLHDKLKEEHIDVSYAMSYSCPLIHCKLSFLAKKTDKLIILPLYPQYSSSTTGAVYDQVFHALRRQKNLPELHILKDYHLHQNYIEQLAKQVETFWQTHARPQKLLISFHSIPVKSAQGDPYPDQCQASAKALATRLQLKDEEWQLVYQSRFGRAAWLTPYCDKVLEDLPQKNIKHVHMICPGFATDCLETLEEISLRYRELFLGAGGKTYAYIKALNADQNQVDLMYSLIKETCL